MSTDELWMREAIKEARLAALDCEVPIGAVVVVGDKIIGRGHNMVQRLNDVSAHAEMIALTAACQYLDAKYLPDCTLYVTLEPCPMCAGMSHLSQVGRIVYGASDPQIGYSRHTPSLLHRKTQVSSGVLESECLALLRSFFRQRRR
mgnify:CR=1 FL=1